VLDEAAYLASVETAGFRPLQAQMWRFTIGRSAPDRPNVRGARWNPPGLPALYLNTTEEGAIAEGNHFLSLLPLTPRGPRHVHRVEVMLERVVDFSSTADLDIFDIDEAVLRDTPGGYSACRRLGAAAESVDRQGILLPCVRCPNARNLVIFTDQTVAGEVSVIDSTELADTGSLRS
jgi:RES domain-containing protein